jgi:hypothetical protein
MSQVTLADFQGIVAVIHDENMELGRQFNACLDTIMLKVVDKINSFEATLNQKFASFEAQFRGLGHPAPLQAGRVDENFKVILLPQ